MDIIDTMATQFSLPDYVRHLRELVETNAMSCNDATRRAKKCGYYFGIHRNGAVVVMMIPD